MYTKLRVGQVYIDWVLTAAIPADGLTKALPKQKQMQFRELVGMRDIGYMISENRGCSAKTA
ncbi:hypothetical protein N7465_006253 [Penicillium sp. CMV-2018d]|nr:hypothetical protein N7465_006253 [Penicillium sp. CMV-2018d]